MNIHGMHCKHTATGKRHEHCQWHAGKPKQFANIPQQSCTRDMKFCKRFDTERTPPG